MNYNPHCLYCGKFMHYLETYDPVSGVPWELQIPWRIWVCICGASRELNTLRDLCTG